MRSFKQFILEAKSPAPSALKKFKHGHKEVENQYLAGDVYDTHSGTYTQVDKYYQGDGDGYIMDKNGNVFDVVVSEWTSDSGRIAGGCDNKSVTIKRVGPNGENISLSGYIAVFSRPSSDTWNGLISDIKDGMYLEDYLRYHQKDIDNDPQRLEWLKALIDNGTENYTSVKLTKEVKQAEKYDAFCQKYVSILDEYLFVCESGTTLKMPYKEAIATIKKSKRSGKTTDVPQEVTDEILSTIKGMAEDILSKNFGSINLAGLRFTFNFTWEGKIKYDSSTAVAWDLKNKKIVIVNYEKHKVLDRIYELRLDSEVWYAKHKDNIALSSEMEKILVDVSKIHIKNLGTETAYIAANYKKLAWGRGYWEPEHSMGEGREMAKEQYRALKDSKLFEPEYTRNFTCTVDEILKVLGTGKYDKFKLTKQSVKPAGETSDITPEVTDGPDKPTSHSKSAEETYGSKAYNVAKEKMQKWHDGTRKQNLKNCNDGKLRMNFAICRELGFDAECDAIRQEAKSRGIVLESIISLANYIQALTE